MLLLNISWMHLFSALFVLFFLSKGLNVLPRFSRVAF